MILIDTSVWIEFFKQNAIYVDTVKSLMEVQRVVAIEPVFSELLFGVRNKKEREIIHSYWQALPKLGFGTGSMIEAAEYASSNNFLQKGIGLMDAVIIKSVKDGNHKLWTLDTRIIRGIDQKLQIHPS